ncbi:MAG: universal stress protein [Gemmatimonadota bacterium]
MTKVDQFESAFRAAAKTPFKFEPVEVGSVLVVTDLEERAASDFSAAVRSYLSVLDRGENVRWHFAHGGEFDTVPELLALIERERPGLICTYRHLHSDSWRWPYTLGEYIDVLTQATTTPVMVLSHPERPPERGVTDTDRVVAMTDHLVGDDRLVNWAARFTASDGRLVLANVEDEVAFERFMDVIAKIPSIQTDDAREQLEERLVRDAHDYIGSCARALAGAGMPFEVDEVITHGHHLSEYRRIVEDQDADLLVMNTKDDDQLAMHGLAYPLAVELRAIPLLLL